MEPTSDIEQPTTDRGGEESGSKGIHVLVENPREIFAALSTIDHDNVLDLTIQNDELNDPLCSSLTTTVNTLSPNGITGPNSYDFSSTFHTDGKGASILKFRHGFISEDQKQTLAKFLEQKNCDDVSINNGPDEHSIHFNYKGNVYYINLGFYDAESKQRWLQRNIERGKFKLGSNYYEKEKEKLSKPVNRNISLGVIEHAVEDRSQEPGDNFVEDLQKYTGAYELMLKGMYKAFGRQEPDKTLTLRYESPKPQLEGHLRVIK